MTFAEVVENALARTLDFDAEFPSTKLPMYRRIGVRQQQLFTLASKINPDYYGSEAGGVLDANYQLDLRDLAGLADLDQAVGIQRVEILDHGTSTVHADGDEVNIVSIDDIDADLSPRVTIRDQVLRGVGTDLLNVTSLCMKYPRVADMPDTDEDGTTDVEVPEPHQELLVVDLTKHLVKKCISMDGEVKVAIVGTLDTEEGELAALYMSDVQNFAIGARHRFSEPAGTRTK